MARIQDMVERVDTRDLSPASQPADLSQAGVMPEQHWEGAARERQASNPDEIASPQSGPQDAAPTQQTPQSQSQAGSVDGTVSPSLDLGLSLGVGLTYQDPAGTTHSHDAAIGVDAEQATPLGFGGGLSQASGGSLTPDFDAAPSIVEGGEPSQAAAAPGAEALPSASDLMPPLPAAGSAALDGVSSQVADVAGGLTSRVADAAEGLTTEVADVTEGLTQTVENALSEGVVSGLDTVASDLVAVGASAGGLTGSLVNEVIAPVSAVADGGTEPVASDVVAPAADVADGLTESVTAAVVAPVADAGASGGMLASLFDPGADETALDAVLGAVGDAPLAAPGEAPLGGDDTSDDGFDGLLGETDDALGSLL